MNANIFREYRKVLLTKNNGVNRISKKRRKGENIIMIDYGNLFDILKSKGMKKTDLLKVISAGSLTKLSKNQNLQMNVINKICAFLETQPGNIMTFSKIMILEKIDSKHGAYEALLLENGFKQRVKICYPNDTYYGEMPVRAPEDFLSKKEYLLDELSEICEKENKLPKDFISEKLIERTLLANQHQQRENNI